MGDPTSIIVDDSLPFRQGIRKLLERNGFSVLAEAGSGEEAKAAFMDRGIDEAPDFVIVDLEMPRTDGIDFMKWMRERSIKTRIIVLSEGIGDDRIRELVPLKIDAHVLKSDGSEELLRSIRSVTGNRKYFSSQVGVKLYDFMGASASKGDQAGEGGQGGPGNQGGLLSERQLEVSKLVAKGKSNREVAQLLGCSENTIKTHKANILRKLDLSNSAELAAWVIRHG